MTVFARRPPDGWAEVSLPLRSELERLGVPIVHAPESGAVAFWCPRWARRLYWSWPTTMAAGGKVGAPGERDLLERAMAAIARQRFGPNQDESTDALLAAFRLGGFDAIERMLRFGDHE